MTDAQPIVGTKCCGNCRNSKGEDALSCEKRPPELGRLTVDYFYVCPLWRAKNPGLYI